MARDRNSNALQIIFSFFLGLMVLAFIGIGVNTFYPSPAERSQSELQDLYRQQERLSNKGAFPSTETSAADRAELERVQNRIDALNKRQEAGMKVWARNTSIVLILFATIVMGISLVRSEQLRVISNGLLLGGLFTMVYGSGWVIFSGQSTARFVVILFAFLVTLGLGYAKFVLAPRGIGAAPAASATIPAEGGAALAGLEARVASLESRAAAAAAALGSEPEATVPPAPRPPLSPEGD